eukprot:scaffold2402_cov74-Phaeocystis_antarctica.AAC.1
MGSIDTCINVLNKAFTIKSGVRFFNGGIYLVSDYVRMEVTLIGASWDVVAGVQAGCGLHSYEALWSTELPCARGRGPVFFHWTLFKETVTAPYSLSVGKPKLLAITNTCRGARSDATGVPPQACLFTNICGRFRDAAGSWQVHEPATPEEARLASRRCYTTRYTKLTRKV